MFNVGLGEIVAIVLVTLLLFGPERLPDLARKAARLLRYLRTVAGSAQQQLSKELGPEFENVDFRDLNPKTFVQKHLLEDVEPIIADVKSEVTDVGKTINSSAPDLANATTKDRSPGGPQDVVAGVTPARPVTPFDLEAT
jgi:sec-independent protein translocase protein TatB